MKKILLFIFLPLSICSQTLVRVEGLYESIQTTSKEASLGCRKNENEDENIVCSDKLISAIQLDVFKYYDLELIYSSALKRSTYIETQDYKDKLSELKLIKTDYTSHTLYLELNKDREFSIGDYDLKKGGFNIYLGSDYQGDKEQYWRTSKNDYQFRQLPIKQLCFFFPINKVMALKIENSIVKSIPRPKPIEEGTFETKKGIELKMILLFKPTGVVKIKYSGYFNLIRTVVTTDKVEVIILDAVTSMLYYRKSFMNLKK